MIDALYPDTLQVLLVEYPHGHGYWDYINELVAYLKKANCEGIQEKMVDVGNNNLGKFESTIAELEIARLLSEKGKHVKLLPDNYLVGKSPDTQPRRIRSDRPFKVYSIRERLVHSGERNGS